jgi:L-fuconolactonase
MTDLGVIDSHIHLWDLKRFQYDWLDGDELLGRTITTDDYREAIHGTPISSYVFMQAAALPEQAVAEAEWAQTLSGVDSRLIGIVADAPLELGSEAARTLDQLARIPKVIGIRRLIQIDDDPDGLCRMKAFIEGVRLLEQYALTFDICIHRSTLPAAAELVSECPDVKFVLDHLGNPNTPDGEFDPWAADVAKLAEHQNVACKLSGMLSLAATDWTAESLKKYADHVIECFGYDRVMYGSDWPVIGKAGTYTQWYDAMVSFLADVPPEDQDRILRWNAIRIYSLSP